MARGTRKPKEPDIEPYRPRQCARRGCKRQAVICTLGTPGFTHEHICLECFIEGETRNERMIQPKGGAP